MASCARFWEGIPERNGNMMLLPGLQYLYVYNDGRFVEPGYPCMFHVEHGSGCIDVGPYQGEKSSPSLPGEKLIHDGVKVEGAGKSRFMACQPLILKAS